MRYDVIPLCAHGAEISQYFGDKGLTMSRELLCLGDFTIVCFTNCCGSTVVCSALSELGLAGKPNKFLNYEFLNADAVREECDALGIASFQAYLRHCVESHSGRSGSFTMKASVQQLNFLWELGALRNFGGQAKLIWVRRRNVLSQAISLWTAEQDGLWTSLHTRSDAPTPVYDEQRNLLAARFIHEFNAWFELFFDYHGIGPLTLWYADFRDNPALLVDKLAAHYDLARPPSGSLLPVARQIRPEKLYWEELLRNHGRGESY